MRYVGHLQSIILITIADIADLKKIFPEYAGICIEHPYMVKVIAYKADVNSYQKTKHEKHTPRLFEHVKT